ncbi:MAG: hypothetical protein ACFFG0_02000 [Candidatus Thorarchaeota archaeon]
MAEDKSRYWTPTRTYEFALKVGSKDITNDVHKVSILTSIDVPYQTFVIDLIIDSNDFILEEIYGQKPLKLTSTLLETSQVPQEIIEFDLMYLSSDMPINIKVDIAEGKQKDRMPISIIAVARQPYKTMNTFVNEIAQGQTVASVIQTLVSNTNATLKMDSGGQNNTVIDQILVPPSTLYKCLGYINKTFGIFDGMPGIYCSHDNVINIKNLTRKMNQAQAFTVYQLGLNVDNDKIIERCSDGKHFYTIRDIDTSYKGNSVFAVLAPQMNFVVKPRDRLYHTIGVDLESFSQNYGLISKSNKIFFDKTALSTDSRITTYKDHTGYELTSSFINANFTKNIGHITETALVVEQSLRILNLMNVGESVEVISATSETSEITGRYILRRSELSFSKSKEWSATGLLTLIRTNRTTT